MTYDSCFENHSVKSVHMRSFSGLNTGMYGSEQTPYSELLHTFHAVNFSNYQNLETTEGFVK